MTIRPQRDQAPQTAGKGGTREAILDAAEHLFAEKGYNGVSMRDIAARAEVALGSLPYYFGTKASLLKEVFLRRTTPIQNERRARMREVLEEAGDGTPDIRKVLEAFLEPAFRQSRTHAAYRQLAGRTATDPTAEVRQVMAEIYTRETMVLPAVLRKALPHLDETELHWRYYCLYGAVQYVQADVGKVQTVAGEEFDTKTPETALRYVIPFLAAALMAPPAGEQ